MQNFFNAVWSISRPQPNRVFASTPKTVIVKGKFNRLLENWTRFLENKG